ncbi:MAG: alanine--glyoxylate aminotransferase family protein [Gammaproteobacteria bacterium]|nr:alanine--glyoxylate aminotransferase family protein [Gammaproteobacteria bacterium]
MENQILPIPSRTLLGPGPTELHPRVIEALAQPTIGHLDPAFVDLMESVKALLQYAFQTNNELTLPVSGPGSVGMETCFVNLIEPGDKVIICQNGVFGGRMREIVERMGATAILIQDRWGEPVDPEKLEYALQENRDSKAVAFVHAETSTGVLSDAKILAEIARRYDCLTIVDAVTSLGGSPLLVDEWQLDAVYSGSQKCLSCVAGLSPVTFSERAVDTIKNRSAPVQSWFMDMNLVMGYWSGGAKRAYHHTAPVNSIFALHAALQVLKEEGLENAWQRHKDQAALLEQGLTELGIEYLVKPEYRLPQLNSVIIPDGVDDASIRTTLLNEYGLEIGGGLGDLAGQIWRIGLMGYGGRRENIELCINALSEVLTQQNEQRMIA